MRSGSRSRADARGRPRSRRRHGRMARTQRKKPRADARGRPSGGWQTQVFSPLHSFYEYTRYVPVRCYGQKQIFIPKAIKLA
jgi:hypothetical protein